MVTRVLAALVLLPTLAFADWREVKWETNFAKAQAKAKKTGKPIFLLHLFGRLDEEFC